VLKALSDEGKLVDLVKQLAEKQKAKRAKHASIKKEKA
jgi:hypothetical protein